MSLHSPSVGLMGDFRPRRGHPPSWNMVMEPRFQFRTGILVSLEKALSSALTYRFLLFGGPSRIISFIRSTNRVMVPSRSKRE